MSPNPAPGLDQQGSPYPHWRSWLIILGLCAAYLALGIAVGPAPEQALLHRGLTASLIDFDEPGSLARGLWPGGYPLLLKGLTSLTNDALLAARLIGVVSLGLLLAATYHLIEALTKRRGLARSCLPFVALFAPLAGDALMASPGLPYAALALWCLYAAVTARKRKLGLFTSGLFAGAAYLFRFQAVALILFGLLAALRLRRNWLGELGLFLGGWLVGALPQLVLAAIAHGNPFHQLSFRVFGQELFGEAHPPDRYTFWWLVWRQPLRTLGGWLAGFGRTALQTLWPLGVLGWWGLWRNRGRFDDLDETSLAITAIGGGILAVAAGFAPQGAALTEGALAAIGPALCVAAAGIWFSNRSWAIPYLALLIMLLRLSYPEVQERVRSGVEARHDAEEVFRLAGSVGVEATERVVGTASALYNPFDDKLVPILSPPGILALDPSLRYARPWAPTEPQRLVAFARATGAGLVVIDDEDSPSRLRPGLRYLGRSGGMSVYEILAPGGSPFGE